MSNLILQAAQFAREKHHGQMRKYTGVPYISHPARVAGRTAVHPEATEDMVAAAFLHDTLEDTDANAEELEDLFGTHVSDLVIDLSDPTHLSFGDTYKGVPRGKRKAIMRASIAAAPRESRIIKLLDRIDNLREMPLTPLNSYIRMYLEESWRLAKAIGSADQALMAELLEICVLTDD